jgi:hypothetical protein
MNWMELENLYKLVLIPCKFSVSTVCKSHSRVHLHAEMRHFTRNRKDICKVSPRRPRVCLSGRLIRKQTQLAKYCG